MLSALGLLFIFFVAVFIIRGQYKKQLRAEGITAKVQVLSKEALTTTKGKTKAVFLYIALFEDAVESEPNDKPAMDTSTIDGKIDALFEKSGVNTPLGNYRKLKIQVPKDRYARIKTGDWIEFVYLKGEPEKGLLKDVL